MNPSAKAAMSGFKFIAWFAIAAAIDVGIQYLAKAHFSPEWNALIVGVGGATLKASATWWATLKQEMTDG